MFRILSSTNIYFICYLLLGQYEISTLVSIEILLGAQHACLRSHSNVRSNLDTLF